MAEVVNQADEHLLLLFVLCLDRYDVRAKLLNRITQHAHFIRAVFFWKRWRVFVVGLAKTRKNFHQNDQNDQLYIKKCQPNNPLLKSLLETIVKKQGWFLVPQWSLFLNIFYRLHYWVF